MPHKIAILFVKDMEQPKVITHFFKWTMFLTFIQAFKSSPEEVQEQINTLLELMTFRAQWQPVDELMRLGGVTLLLQVIAFAYEWNYSGR